jgi:prepilin-type N-terminal cleavage/methylation domain-containing protein
MPRSKKKSVLIVDRDKRLAEIFAKRFEEIGWRAATADKIADAKKRAAKISFDAILFENQLEQINELLDDPSVSSSVKVCLGDCASGREVDEACKTYDAYFLKTHIVPLSVVRKTKELIDMKMKQKLQDKESGFTLVELLVVIGIIVLIMVFAAVAVNAARSKQRDVVRISNVRQIQSALEDYFNENNTYPVGSKLPLGDASQSACLGATGFAAGCSSSESTFLRTVLGTYEGGLEGEVVCGEPSRKALCYSLRDNGNSYMIYFELENNFVPVGLRSGVNCASQNGMEAGVCKE